MSKFRNKPVVIEAVQWTGENGSALRAFILGAGFVEDGGEVEINTLEGKMVGNVGDWIIKGVKGEFYPCKPDIFEATYGSVTEADGHIQELQIQNLSVLLRRALLRIPVVDGKAHPVVVQAREYLQRQGLNGSSLRDDDIQEQKEKKECSLT
jgi:hypothetical protein